MRVSEASSLLLYDESQTLKQQLATGASCDAEMEQSSVNASKNVLRYMDALHSMAAKSRNTIRESFCGSFASLVWQLQTLLKQEVAAVSKLVDDYVREIMIDLLREHL